MENLAFAFVVFIILVASILYIGQPDLHDKLLIIVDNYIETTVEKKQ